VETIDTAYRVLLWGSVIFLCLLILAFLIQAVRGPRFTDRVISINLVCTKGIITIALLSYLRQDNSLLDIAVVYSMISFLFVVVLSKCYTSLHQIDPLDLRLVPRGEKEEAT
jgi:multicomponent Na+:H+ antiporter subunit F